MRNLRSLGKCALDCAAALRRAGNSDQSSTRMMCREMEKLMVSMEMGGRSKVLGAKKFTGGPWPRRSTTAEPPSPDGATSDRESNTATASSSSSGSSSSSATEEVPVMKDGQGMPAAPWTPTRLLAKRKTLPKRMGYMLSVLEKEKEEEAMKKMKRPNFTSGDMLEVTLNVPQNKGRTTVFKGVCIAKKNKGWRTSFILRNFIGNSGGIERTFSLYSPHIQDIKVLKSSVRRKYRRSKLYYLRDVQPKMYRIA